MHVEDPMLRAYIGEVVTFANIVLPVPGGPCIRIFLYIPRFRFVFFVAIAMSLKQDKSLWCSAEWQYVAKVVIINTKMYICLTLCYAAVLNGTYFILKDVIILLGSILLYNPWPSL
jgi:hypothetical protein